VGRFFHEAASSVVTFSEVVGTAFQCQMFIALLNATITCIGLVILDIQPVMLLTTIVLLFGLIPVLGVFISSVPIILIAFNDHGVNHALLALGMIVIVHMLEAYVFNPRIYAARFHLNPVMVLIILLVAHEMFGVWGMLLGIPVTHYVLNIAQMPSYPRKRRRRRRGVVESSSAEPAAADSPAAVPVPGE
jgi:predicted PurR-regulated permease PerM